MAQKLFFLFWAYMYVLIYYNTCMSILVDIYIGSCFRGEKMFFRDVGCQLLLLAWMVKLDGGGGKNKG